MPMASSKGRTLTSNPAKPDRHRVDLSTSDLARRWCKHFGKSKESIDAAVAKVGDNTETVMKELGVRKAPVETASPLRPEPAARDGVGR